MRGLPRLRTWLLIFFAVLPVRTDAQEDVEIGGIQVHLQRDSAPT